MSPKVFAYYGLIRASRPRPWAYLLRLRDFLKSRGSPICSGCLCQRAIPSTPVDQEGALGCFFPSRAAFAFFAESRRPQFPHKSVRMRSCNEAASGSLSLRPVGLLALHRQELLLSSFHLLSRLIEMSSITTRLPANYRGRPSPGQTPSPMGCERRARRKKEHEDPLGPMSIEEAFRDGL